MLVKENMVSRNVLTEWAGYRDSSVKIEGDRVFGGAGKENGTILKTYLSLSRGLSKSLDVGKDYSLYFYFENLREYPISLRFNGLDISTYAIEGNFKGIVAVSGKRISDTYVPQLQVRSHNPAYYIQFRCNTLMVTEGDILSELWIPAKTDLPTNQQAYYLPDGDYNEIKAI